jgi:dTDP-4-amino-4,6-dideoxygalactose transaminase
VIPFLDLKAQHTSLKGELEAAACRVLGSGQYVLGEEVERFEERFASSCGTRFAIALNTGTSALPLALLAAGVGPGDEVITTSMTFIATTAAIVYTGARPVLIDIDPVTWTIDPVRTAAAVTPRTKAVVPVHLHGRMAAMDPLLALADAHGLAVIEDAAQAHGAEQAGRRAGSIGDAGCFSFYPGKNLGACGEGGAVVTNDARLADTVRLLRDWGQAGKYRHVAKGYNYRMDAIQAAILAVKLGHIEAWTEARRRHARRYDALLAGAEVGLPAVAPDGEHVYHVYAVRARERDQFRHRLSETGVATGIHYPVPVHLQPAYADLGYQRGDFPIAEAVAAETLSLPMYPELSPDQTGRVAEAVRAVAAAVVVGERR